MIQKKPQPCLATEIFEGAIAGLTDANMPLPDDVKNMLAMMAKSTLEAGEWAEQTAHSALEQATEAIGTSLEPIAQNPGVQAIANIPGLNWLLVWIGRVDTEKALAEVAELKRKHPTESDEQIAQRVVQSAALQASRIGLLTNLVPSIALALMAVDLAAVTRLQADMLYRIAAAYDLPLNEPARRGELVALYSLSFGTGTPIKAGLNFVELIPLIGTLVGASSDALLVYILGQAACRFYSTKQQNKQV